MDTNLGVVENQNNGRVNFILPRVDTALINNLYFQQERKLDKGYLYLTSNFNKIGEKDSIFYHPDCDTCECGYLQKFQYGILYKERCLESGIQIIYEFPTLKSNDIRQWVEALFFTVNHIWEDQNNYVEKEGGAGCYYQIIQSDSKTVVDVYCGC